MPEAPCLPAFPTKLLLSLQNPLQAAALTLQTRPDPLTLSAPPGPSLDQSQAQVHLSA